MRIKKVFIMQKIIYESELSCPECGHKEILKMPSDACQWFHKCSYCGIILKPKRGDCCVFCSFGSVPCPPMQEENSAKMDYCNCTSEVISL